MSTYYLFSGFSNVSGFTDEISNHLKQTIPCNHCLVFIGAYAQNYGKTDEDYLQRIQWFSKIGIHLQRIQWFSKIGIHFQQIHVLDNRTPPNEILPLLNKATVVYLLGGDPFEQIEFIHFHHLQKQIQQTSAVVLGESAGAINMCNQSICSRDDYYPKTTVYSGLGLIHFSVDPHFSIRNTDLIQNDLIPLSNQLTIMGLCDDSAIIINNETILFSNPVFRIKSGVIEELTPTGL